MIDPIDCKVDVDQVPIVVEFFSVQMTQMDRDRYRLFLQLV